MRKSAVVRGAGCLSPLVFSSTAKPFTPPVGSQFFGPGIQPALCCTESSSTSLVYSSHCSSWTLLHWSSAVHDVPVPKLGTQSPVTNGSPGSKSQCTLEEDANTIILLAHHTKSFWPYGQRGTLTLSLIDVLEHWLQRLLQNFLVSVPLSATLNWLSFLLHWNDGDDLVRRPLLSKNPQPSFHMCYFSVHNLIFHHFISVSLILFYFPIAERWTFLKTYS